MSDEYFVMHGYVMSSMEQNLQIQREIELKIQCWNRGLGEDVQSEASGREGCTLHKSLAGCTCTCCPDTLSTPLIGRDADCLGQ